MGLRGLLFAHESMAVKLRFVRMGREVDGATRKRGGRDVCETVRITQTVSRSFSLELLDSQVAELRD